MREDLFDRSIVAGGRFSHLLIQKPEYKDLVTFAWCKNTPVYNWFYYKEGYAGELVWNLLDRLNIKKGSTILDPFCGTGTTLLACKQKGYNAVGYDILPLGVFVSNTKLQQDYDMSLLQENIRDITKKKFTETRLKWPDLGFIDVKRAFSKYARKDLLFFKENIMEVEDEKIRNFLMLALLSITLQASNVKKDGGVLKIMRKRNLPPVRHLFKNKLKRMNRDLKKSEPTPPGGFGEARLGDACTLKLEPGSIDACITSPPYLNWVDYTKVYALELGLLVNSSKDMKELRKKSLRSHAGAQQGRDITYKSEKMRTIMENISDAQFNKKAQVIEGYFEDMYASLSSVYEALKEKGKAAFVVGNVCLPETIVDTDLILAELGEEMGFTTKEILVANVRWCDVHGIRKPRPVRESIVVFEK